MANDEDEIRDGWLTAAREWSAQIAPRVMSPFRQTRLTPDPVSVLSTQGVWMEELRTNVSPGIVGALRTGWRYITGRPPEPTFDMGQYVAAYLSQSLNRMVGTPEQVYRLITQQLAEGIENAESVPELAARVQGVFEVTGNPWWENRATVVARTEVQAAINAGSLAGAGQQQIDTGRSLVKVWAAIDQPERTRPEHLVADGQVQPLTAPFTVGGEALQFPGDPSGSAWNVIQCRCTMTFREQ